MSKSPDSVDRLDSHKASDVMASSSKGSPAFEPLTVIHTDSHPSSSQPSEQTEDKRPAPSLDPQLAAVLFPEDSTPQGVPSPKGLMLEHFRIESRIGAGGMGFVFRACDTLLDRTVAVKILSPSHAHDLGTVDRFRNEAKATARLDHENIARVYFYGEDKGVHFIAYEFVTGPNLREILIQKGILSPDEAVNYTLQIASAIQHASDAGVIHRDIKPSNIIVTPSGRAKLVDLGLARKQISPQSDELTIAGTTLGTFDYISPEQAKDPRTVDIRSDIYSLGCTLYHLLTGKPPYAEGTVLQKLLDHQAKSPPNPSHENPLVPSLLSTVVQKMMASEPKNRYSTADDLIHDLMLVSGELELKTVGPDGFVWTAVLKDNRKFWERHLGLILTTVLLLVIVIFVDRYPILFQTEAGQRPDISQINSNEGNLDRNNNSLKLPIKGNPSRNNSSTNKLTSKNPTNGHPINGRRQNENTQNGSPELQPDSFTRKLRQFFSQDDQGGFFKWAKALGFSNEPANPSTAMKDDPSDRSTGTPVLKPRITIMQDGEERAFASLEAACTAAKDGDVVLLKFHGIRLDDTNRPVIEQPINIRNKKIAIRAAEGFHPAIEFTSESSIAQQESIRIVNLSHASLEIYNVELRVRSDPDLAGSDDRRWALFALHGIDRLFLKGVNITFEGQNQSFPSIVVDLMSRLPVDLADMAGRSDSPINTRAKPKIQFQDCFIRGNFSLFSDSRQTGMRLEIENTVIAIDGAVIEVATADHQEIGEERLNEIDLEHVTCLAKKGLLNDTRQTDSNIPPLYSQFTARGNLFSMSSSEPLISSAGVLTVTELRKRIRWNGGQNYYDRIGTFWKLNQTREPNMEKKLIFKDWIQHWNYRNGDLDAHNEAILWAVDWKKRMSSRIKLSHLTLLDPVPPLTNPAVTGASDGKVIGARLEQLKPFERKTGSTGIKRDVPFLDRNN